ncbi:MAG: hypothetical protein SWE60_06310 [Thermodesulfobacteriota bacterium]|nr:hypothetical protein [Thermodesulfobacteriota bacterium]
MMRRIFRSLFFVGLTLFLGGCLEIHQDFTLNPDGSGKVVHDARFQEMSLSMDDSTPDPKQEMLKAVRGILDNSEGVEAWKDVSYELDEQGMIHFTGTAYFKDINAMKISTGSTDVAGFSPVWEEESPGRQVLRLVSGDASDQVEEEKEGGKEADFQSMSPAERQEYLRQERAKFQQMRPMMVAMLSGMTIDKTYRLPGTIASVSGFRRTDENCIAMTVKGSKLIEVFDDLLGDDAWMTKMAAQGKDWSEEFPALDAQVNERLFGVPGPVQAAVSVGDAVLFDYGAEVKEAGNAFEALRASLPKGVKARSQAIPMKGGMEFEKVEIGGIRLIRDLGDESIRPFNYPAGLTLCLVGFLPGPVLDVKEGSVEKAVTDSGRSLLTSDHWGGKISFPTLAGNQDVIIFEVSLQVPAAEDKRLKELSGNLTYLIAKGSREVDLGIRTFKPGSVGTQFGVKVSSLGPDEWAKSAQSMELSMDFDMDTLKEAKFFDKGGQQLEVDRSGYSSMGNQLAMTFRKDGTFPPEGKIVFVVHEQLETYSISFLLKDIPLEGMAPPVAKGS